MLGSCIAVVTQPTRLEGLMERWTTKSAAKFRFRKFRAHEHVQRQENEVQTNQALALADMEADFDLYESEDEGYRRVVKKLRDALDFDVPVVVVERQHIPNFMFTRAEVIVVIGQDGLVANTAKYAHGLPIIGVNPDPERIDGVLLPYQVDEVRAIVRKVLDGRYRSRDVTLAEAKTNDGQQMLAFNDFFIGQSRSYFGPIHLALRSRCGTAVVQWHSGRDGCWFDGMDVVSVQHDAGHCTTVWCEHHTSAAAAMGRHKLDLGRP